MTDRKRIYDRKIAPIVRDLKVMCLTEHMPMFVSVAVGNTENGTEYVNNAVLGAAGVKLKDNRIADMLLRINGFENKLPEEVLQAADTIERYINDATAVAEGASGMKLNDDIISAFCGIAAGDKVVTVEEEEES